MKAEKHALMEKSRFLKKGIVPTHVDYLGITEEGLARAWSWPRSPSTMRPWGNILEEGSVPGDPSLVGPGGLASSSPG